jgi:hypothetical protein
MPVMILNKEPPPTRRGHKIETARLLAFSRQSSAFRGQLSCLGACARACRRPFASNLGRDASPG